MMTFCEKWNDTNLIHREIVVWILIKMYIAKSNGLAAVSFLSLLVLGVDTKCSVREPSGVNSPPQHGDAGFHLSINEEPEFYEERNLYTITLKVIFIYKYILLKYIISTARQFLLTLFMNLCIFQDAWDIINQNVATFEWYGLEQHQGLMFELSAFDQTMFLFPTAALWWWRFQSKQKNIVLGHDPYL